MDQEPSSDQSAKDISLLSEISRLRRLCQADPENHEQQLYLGELLQQVADHNGAIVAYRRCLELEPNCLAAYLKLAICYRKLGFFERARVCYEDLLKREPKNAAALSDLAAMNIERGAYEQAKEQLTTAFAATADNLTVKRNLFLVEYMLGNYKSALKVAKTGVGNPAATAEDWRQYGLALAKDQQYTAAIDSYHQAEKMGLADGELFSNLATAYFNVQDKENAAKFHQKAIELAPNNGDILFNYGEFLVQQQDFKSASEVLQKLIKLSPQDAEAWFYLGQCLLGPQPSRALSCFERALEQKMSTAPLYRAMAKAASALYDKDKELLYRQKLQLKEPLDAHNNLKLGQLMMMDGDFKTAWDTLKRINELDPAAKNIWQKIAAAFAARGFLLSEAYCLKRISQQAEVPAAVWSRMGEIALAAKQGAVAYEYFQKKSAKLPLNAADWLSLTRFFLKNNELPLALDCFKQLQPFFASSNRLVRSVIRLFIAHNQLAAVHAEVLSQQPEKISDYASLINFGAQLMQFKPAEFGFALLDHLGKIGLQHLVVLRFLVTELLNIGEAKRAIQWIRQKISTHGPDDEAWLLLAECFIFERNFSLAADHCNKVELTSQNNHRYWLVKGNLEVHHQRYQEAYGFYHRALSLSTSDPVLYYKMAELAFKLAQFKSALDHLQTALSLEPEFTFAWELLADIKLQHGHLLSAKHAYLRALVNRRHSESLHGKFLQLKQQLNPTTTPLAE